MDANVGARGFWDSLKSESRRVRLLALQVGEVAPRQASHGDTLATDSGPSRPTGGRVHRQLCLLCLSSHQVTVSYQGVGSIISKCGT